MTITLSDLAARTVDDIAPQLLRTYLAAELGQPRGARKGWTWTGDRWRKGPPHACWNVAHMLGERPAWVVFYLDHGRSPPAARYDDGITFAFDAMAWADSLPDPRPLDPGPWAPVKDGPLPLLTAVRWVLEEDIPWPRKWSVLWDAYEAECDTRQRARVGGGP
jgi:hypothetical protein